MLTRIIPVTIDGQEIYPTNFAVIALDPLQHYQWQTVTVPEQWATQGYYYEIWDNANRPLAEFTAQRLTTSTIDLSRIDPSLIPAIRLVVFKPTTVATTLDVATQPIYFTYQVGPNYSLLGLIVLLSIIYFSLIIAALHWRITAQVLWQETKLLLLRKISSTVGKQIVIYGWLTTIWSGIFGVVLGTYISGIQIIYLLIKLPFLLLGALIFSLVSLIVLSLLLGIKTTVLEMVVRAMQLLAITALALAAFSPIMWFYINLPQAHDQLLVSMVIFFCLAGGLAALCLQQWIKRWIITIVWVMLYGLVILQLGWLLRPWVGITDDLHSTLPFTRLYSGNVFVELFNTINRIK